MLFSSLFDAVFPTLASPLPARSFYKHMLGLVLTYEDIEAVDPEYYKNLRWMLENDITDVLELTFTAETDFFGKKDIVELVPGGRDIKVGGSSALDLSNPNPNPNVVSKAVSLTAAFRPTPCLTCFASLA